MNNEFEYNKSSNVKKGRAAVVRPFEPALPESRDAIWLLEAYCKPFSALIKKYDLTPRFGFMAGSKKRMGNFARFIVSSEPELRFTPVNFFGEKTTDDEVSRFINPGLYKDCDSIRHGAEADEIRGEGSKGRRPDISAFSVRQGFKNSALIEIESSGGAMRQAVKNWFTYIKTLEFSETNIVRKIYDTNDRYRRKIFSGSDFIIERISGFSIRVCAGNNPHQNSFAIEKAASWLGSFVPKSLDASAIVCCDGAGVYSMAVASKFPHVVTTPFTEIGSADIEHNARYNGLKNIKVVKKIEDAGVFLNDLEMAIISENLGFASENNLLDEILTKRPKNIALLAFEKGGAKTKIERIIDAGYKMKDIFVFEYIPTEKVGLYGMFFSLP